MKAKFSTPFGIEGNAVVTMSHFEADVVAVLPRTTNKIEIKKVTILNMENLHLDVCVDFGCNRLCYNAAKTCQRGHLTQFCDFQVKTQSADSPQMDLSKIANSFLKTTPKGVLYPMIGTFVKRFAQQFLDENPLPF